MNSTKKCLSSLSDDVLMHIATFLSEPYCTRVYIGAALPPGSSFRKYLASQCWWYTLDLGHFPFNTRLTDRDIEQILQAINAVETVRKLSLTNCINVHGFGLAPLKGSKVIEHIDLSKVGQMPANQPRISEEHVVPILESIISDPSNSLKLVQYPPKWRANNENHHLRRFLKTFEKVLAKRKYRCFSCNTIVANDCENTDKEDDSGSSEIKESTQTSNKENINQDDGTDKQLSKNLIIAESKKRDESDTIPCLFFCLCKNCYGTQNHTCYSCTNFVCDLTCDCGDCYGESCQLTHCQICVIARNATRQLVKCVVPCVCVTIAIYHFAWLAEIPFTACIAMVTIAMSVVMLINVIFVKNGVVISAHPFSVARNVTLPNATIVAVLIIVSVARIGFAIPATRSNIVTNAWAMFAKSVTKPTIVTFAKECSAAIVHVLATVRKAIFTCAKTVPKQVTTPFVDAQSANRIGITVLNAMMWCVMDVFLRKAAANVIRNFAESVQLYPPVTFAIRVIARNAARFGNVKHARGPVVALVALSIRTMCVPRNGNASIALVCKKNYASITY